MTFLCLNRRTSETWQKVVGGLEETFEVGKSYWKLRAVGGGSELLLEGSKRVGIRARLMRITSSGVINKSGPLGGNDLLYRLRLFGRTYSRTGVSRLQGYPRTG